MNNRKRQVKKLLNAELAKLKSGLLFTLFFAHEAQSRQDYLSAKHLPNADEIYKRLESERHQIGISMSREQFHRFGVKLETDVIGNFLWDKCYYNEESKHFIVYWYGLGFPMACSKMPIPHPDYIEDYLAS